MAALTDPPVLLVVTLPVTAAVYTVTLLTLDRFMELLHRCEAVQQFQVIWQAGVRLVRLAVTYVVTRQRIRRIGRR